MDILNRFYETASCFGKDVLNDPADRLNTPYVHFDSVEKIFNAFTSLLDSIPAEYSGPVTGMLWDILTAYERQGFVNGFKYGVSMVQELAGMSAGACKFDGLPGEE